MNRFDQLENAWLELLLRWGLGGMFIYASIHKILHPDIFAKIVYGYDLFPHVAINLIAILVPYIELTSGLCLLTGVFPKGASMVINALLFLFIVFISINLIRGHQFDCGCFSADEQTMNTPGWTLLIRDMISLAAGVYVLLFNGPRKARLPDFFSGSHQKS